LVFSQLDVHPDALLKGRAKTIGVDARQTPSILKSFHSPKDPREDMRFPELVRLRRLLTIGVILSSIAGCGGGGDNLPREPVSGTVTLDGAPLETGTISFMSADPAGASTAVGATIKNGSYSIAKGEGPVPGPYRVIISSPYEEAPDPKKLAQSHPGDGDAPTVRDKIPPKYNSKSTEKVEVEKGGKNVFDFPITSK